MGVPTAEVLAQAVAKTSMDDPARSLRAQPVE
jgi:hypothetical protein